MNKFKQIFDRKEPKGKSEIDSSKFNTFEKSDYNSFEELIEQNAGLSFEKQMIFGDVVGSNAWELDMEKGNISFANLKFPIQIIGSLSFNSSSWMWGWANTQSKMPENLLLQSNQLKKIGQNKNINELTKGHLSVAEGFEHKIGMLACGLFKSSSYYCANYGQGTLVVTIKDNKIPEINKNRFEKTLTAFLQFISVININHKAAFKNYLIDKKFKLSISETTIKGIKENKILVAEFDELNRLKSLNEI